MINILQWNLPTKDTLWAIQNSVVLSLVERLFSSSQKFPMEIWDPEHNLVSLEDKSNQCPLLNDSLLEVLLAVEH